MLRIQLIERIMNLPPLGVRPWLLGKFDRRLHGGPTAKRPGRKDQAPTTACSAHDTTARHIERRGTPWRRNLPARDALIERRCETKEGQDAYLQRKQRLSRWDPLVERFKKPHGSIEHGGLRLVIRHPFPDDSHGCPCSANGLEASEDPVKGAINRHPLEVSKLTTARS
jgi:hypothetical protein